MWFVVNGWTLEGYKLMQQEQIVLHLMISSIYIWIYEIQYVRFCPQRKLDILNIDTILTFWNMVQIMGLGYGISTIRCETERGSTFGGNVRAPPSPSSCSANIKISSLVSSLQVLQRTATVNVCSLNYMVSVWCEHKS